MVCLYTADELGEADAFIEETISLYHAEQDTGDAEFSRLLIGLAERKQLPHGIIDAIAHYAGSIGLRRTLNLIQESPVVDKFLPIVTALQQELGQDPQVSMEIDEVAQDVRGKILEARAQITSGVPTVTAIGVGKLKSY